MLMIRFARVGKRNKAQFKIMLQEKTAAPGGRHVEVLGSYDPHTKTAVLKDERINYWLSQGAGTSDTVHNLLVTKGLITDKKRAVKLPEKEVAAEDTAVAREGGEAASSAAEKATDEGKKEETGEEKKEEKAETKPEEATA